MHRLRAGQGSQSVTAKVATIASLPRWAHGVQDTLGPGLRDWFGSLGRYPVKAAAFDTRVRGPAALTGRASKGVAHLLREHGFELAAEPESFLVTRQDRLEPQKTARAREWGTNLAADIAPSSAQGTRS